MGQHEEVARHCVDLVKAAPEDAGTSFFAAQLFGRCVEMVVDDEELQEEDRQRWLTDYRQQVLTQLRATRELAGATAVLSADGLRKEAGEGRAFYHLRDHAEFLALIASLD